ncbi:PREDICTED: uncharacterized protein LOC108661904 [Theobroma cacao]|uniref:Uncharacterized protein LOC108661904 n=1 Tax=Theobroma cacao TaxID=3641 RepID=A0AB32WFK1_THECC|nr:PREDICTED: uncharacterized protein LOC108661904 [Theobroma cacao]
MLFTSVHDFKEVMTNYIIQEGIKLYRAKNEKTRYKAYCKGNGYKWMVHANLCLDKKTFKIKKVINEHFCIRISNNNSAIISVWIVNKLVAQLQFDPNMSYNLMQHELQQRYEMMKDTNLDSIVIMQLERPKLSMYLTFKSFFLSFDALRTGFDNGCRPLIGVDVYHLKGPCKGALLSAIAINGNCGLFLVVVAIVEIENGDFWSLFLNLVNTAIGDLNKPLVVMSDGKKRSSSRVVGSSSRIVASRASRKPTGVQGRPVVAASGLGGGAHNGAKSVLTYGGSRRASLARKPPFAGLATLVVSTSVMNFDSAEGTQTNVSNVVDM